MWYLCVTCDSAAGGLTLIQGVKVVFIGLTAAVDEALAALTGDVVVKFREGGST